MRIGRHELLLVAGLILALAIIFSGPVMRFLDEVRSLETSHGLVVVPGVAVALASVGFYFYGKRKERLARLVAEASQGPSRAGELERLITFWQALTQSLDLEAIRDVVESFLPELSGSRDGWLVSGSDGNWRLLFGPKTVSVDGQEVAVVDLAADALHSVGLVARPDGIEFRGQVCFPMIAAGSTLGVLGLPATRESLPHARRFLVGAAAALLAVSVRSVQLLQAVREASLRDALTGCVNRGHALEVISAELLRARRTGHPVAMIMADVDRFKRVNDKYGHLCGDAVLAEVGAAIRTALRGSDLKCRYGGEEFLLLLPETPIEGARRVAEQLRRDIADLEIPWGGTRVRVTSSFGIAMAVRDELDPSALIERADQALYRAKREGRDCIRVAETPAPAAAAPAPEAGPASLPADKPRLRL